MIWSDLKRHQAQVEMFRRAIERGRTAQGYLFVGPRGIGKRTFARKLAQCLFCQRIPDAQLEACGACNACQQVAAGTHPDLLEIGCPEGKRELPLELIVGAKERRGREGLCHDLSLRPMSANRRIAIIDDADLMNEESANALLKTLEEPPLGAILILLTPDIDPILPTIRSRCQPVRFAPLKGGELSELLLKTGSTTDAALAREVAALADGSLETAQELLEPELRELRTVLIQALSANLIDGLATSESVSGQMEKMGGDTSEQRRRAGWLLRFAVEHLRGQLAITDDPDRLERIGEMIDRCLLSEVHLKQSMPVPLCLEGLFDGLGRISRSVMA